MFNISREVKNEMRLKEKEKLILKYLKNKEGVNKTELAFKTGCNSDYIDKYLSILKREKLIERIKLGRYFYWRLRVIDDKNKK